MSLLRRTASFLAPAVGGAVAAIVVLVVLPGDQDTAREGSQDRYTPAQRARSINDLQLPRSAAGFSAAVLDRNSERLAELESRLDDLPDSGDGQLPDDDALYDAPVPDDAEARDEMLAQWQDKLDRHDNEEIDEAWSAEATPRFETDLETIAGDAGFTTLDVQCMSSTCSATLKYESFRNATQGFADLLHHHYEENCTTEILLPDPEDPKAPYVATILYDCADARAQAG